VEHNRIVELREHLPRYPVPAARWARAGRAVLRIDGLVARPVVLTQADLARLPHSILDEPFTCEEGWSVPGLRWGGVGLADVLPLAQPLPAARYVRAAAGSYVVPMPLADAAAALVGDELNGDPLSIEHGAPWRLLVPGGACYTSVKWLDRLELSAEPGENTAERLARARLEAARSTRSWEQTESQAHRHGLLDGRQGRERPRVHGLRR
jgi:DMSO/TMAO reductase YedYZ molybdopterin-dependent catalytic subunit